MSEPQSPELFAHQALSVAEENHQKILNKAERGQVSREHIPPCVTTAHRENQDEQFTLAKGPASPHHRINRTFDPLSPALSPPRLSPRGDLWDIGLSHLPPHSTFLSCIPPCRSDTSPLTAPRPEHNWEMSHKVHTPHSQEDATCG